MENSGNDTVADKRSPLFFPSWWSERPGLIWDFYPTAEKFEGDVDLSQMSIDRQEALIVDDLLRCLNGIEGKYIKTPSLPSNQNTGRTFHVDRTLHVSLREMVKQIIPICEAYSTVIRFVDQSFCFTECIVRQAIGSALMEKLQAYYTFVAQVECNVRQSNQRFGLQQLWCASEPIKGNMTCLAELAELATAKPRTWCELLDIVHEQCRKCIGDESDHNLMLSICEVAFYPFLESLNRLLRDGWTVGKDHFGFGQALQLLESSAYFNDDGDEDNKWKSIAALPSFIPTGCHHLIWRTGYYLNLTKRSGDDYSDMNGTPEPDISYSHSTRQVRIRLEQAFERASKMAFRMLVDSHDLIGRLTSMRRYFLLNQGDFVVQFLDTAWHELVKSAASVSVARLQSLFYIAVRMSSCSQDKYSEDVCVCLLQYDLLTELALASSSDEQRNVDYPKANLLAYRVLTLQYDMPWPASLLLNERASRCLKLLSNHLLYLKFIERYLGITAPLVKGMYRCAMRRRVDCKIILKAYMLGNQMLQFVQALLGHASVAVFEPKWHQFLECIAEQTDSDGRRLSRLVSQMNTMLMDFFRGCLLDNLNLLRLLYSCVEVCNVFTANLFKVTEAVQAYHTGSTPKMSRRDLISPSSLYRHSDEAAFSTSFNVSRSSSTQSFGSGRSAVGNQETERTTGASAEEKFARWVNMCQSLFSQKVINFMKALLLEQQCSGQPDGSEIASSLLVRLDFNGFYNRQLVKTSA